jgi:hypothetical protein
MQIITGAALNDLLSSDASGNAGTVTNGVYTTDTGTVTGVMIASGTIINSNLASGVFGNITGLGTQTQGLTSGTGMGAQITPWQSPLVTRFRVHTTEPGQLELAVDNRGGFVEQPQCTGENMNPTG